MLNSCSIKFTFQRKAAAGAISPPPAIIRRGSLAFDNNKERPISLSDVTSLAQQLYNVDVAKHVIALTWVDEEEDVVTMSSELEFDEYLKQLRNPIQLTKRNPEILKFGVLLGPRPLETKVSTDGKAIVPESQSVAAAVVPKQQTPQEGQTCYSRVLNALKAEKCAAGVDPITAPLLKKAAYIAAEASNAARQTQTQRSAAECGAFKAGVLNDIQREKSNMTRGSFLAELNSVNERRKYIRPLIDILGCGPKIPEIGHAVESYKQTWVVRNNGSSDITNLSMVFDYGDPLPIHGIDVNDLKYFKYAIGTIKANRSKRIVVNLSVPSPAGTYTANFQMLDKNGNRVGNPLKATVTRKPKPLSPTVTQCPLPQSHAQKAAIPPTAAAAVPCEEVPSENFGSASKALAPAPKAIAAPYVDSEDRIAFRQWAAELHVLKLMGFFDKTLNVRLLKKHVRSPSNAMVGEMSNISNYAMNEIVTELMMLQGREEKRDQARKAEALDNYFPQQPLATPSLPSTSTSPADVDVLIDEDVPLLNVGTYSSSGEEEEEDFVMLMHDRDSCY